MDGVAGDGIGRLATSRDGWQPMSDESAMFLPFFPLLVVGHVSFFFLFLFFSFGRAPNPFIGSLGFHSFR